MSSLSAPSHIIDPQTKDKVGLVGKNECGYLRDKIQPMNNSTDHARRTSPLWRLGIQPSLCALFNRVVPPSVSLSARNSPSLFRSELVRRARFFLCIASPVGPLSVERRLSRFRFSGLAFCLFLRFSSLIWRRRRTSAEISSVSPEPDEG